MQKKISLIELINRFIEEGKVVLPVFSSTALRVQQELVKKDPNMKILANTIAADQALSSQVLQTANSAFYQGLVEVKTLPNAIVRLGMREVARITLMNAAKNQFRSSEKLLNYIMKRLWQHSVGCAMGAKWLAKRCNLGELESEAFFAGLLHDSGKLFVLMVIEQMKKKNRQLHVTSALLHEAMTLLHNEQGYNLLKTWNLPESYCQVAKDHNKQDFDSKNLLLLVIRVANMTCNSLGIGLIKDSELVVSSSEEAQILNLSEIDLAELEVLLEDSKTLTA